MNAIPTDQIWTGPFELRNYYPLNPNPRDFRAEFELHSGTRFMFEALMGFFYGPIRFLTETCFLTDDDWRELAVRAEEERPGFTW